MKRICAAVIVFTAFAVFAASCKKKTTEPAAIQPVMYIPFTGAPYAAGVMATNDATATIGAPLGNVWGMFLSSTVVGVMYDTANQYSDHYEGWQEAFFCGTDGTGFISPKAVSLNNTALSRAGDSYSATGQWHSGSLNHWEVTEDENVPEVSRNMMDTYPIFTGTFPANVSLVSGLTYTFITTKIKNADSAYILIHSNGHVARSNTVSVQSGTSPVVKITKDQLTDMHNEYFSFDNKVFRGAVFEIVLYKDSLETFGNKQFAFVTQRQEIRKIVFN